jgi:hypothetical protein
METKLTSVSLTDPVEPDPHRSRFIEYAGIGLLVFVVIAFGAAAIVQPFRLARYAKPEVIVHIVLVLSWVILFIVQSRLAGAGAISRHRKNLRLGALLVFLITVQGIYLTYKWGDAMRLIGESRDVLTFAALFIAAIWAAMKGRFEAHKRLILIAALNLVGPAYIRLGFVLDWSIPTVILATVLTWILPPIAYDLLSRRAIHRATLAGIAFSIVTYALVLAIVFSPAIVVIESWFFS